MRYKMGRAVRVDGVNGFPTYGAISFRSKPIMSRFPVDAYRGENIDPKHARNTFWSAQHSGYCITIFDSCCKTCCTVRGVKQTKGGNRQPKSDMYRCVKV